MTDLAQIVEIRIEPIPEGPLLEPFVRTPPSGGHSLDEIADFIPLPLPPEIRQSCEIGGDLTVTLTDGRELVYGPCQRPLEIDRLWWHIIDIVTKGGCRPECWPGDPPPGEEVPPDVTP